MSDLQNHYKHKISTIRYRRVCCKEVVVSTPNWSAADSPWLIASTRGNRALSDPAACRMSIIPWAPISPIHLQLSASTPIANSALQFYRCTHNVLHISYSILNRHKSPMPPFRNFFPWKAGADSNSTQQAADKSIPPTGLRSPALSLRSSKDESNEYKMSGKSLRLGGGDAVIRCAIG